MDTSENKYNTITFAIGFNNHEVHRDFFRYFPKESYLEIDKILSTGFTEENINKLIAYAEKDDNAATFVVRNNFLPYTEEQLDIIIDKLPITNVKHIFKREDLTPKQIDTVIKKYELLMAGNLGTLMINNRNDFSQSVINHLIDTRQKDMERWNYVPYQLMKNKEKIKEIETNILAGTMNKINSQEAMSYMNNPLISGAVRDMLYHKVTDVTKLEYPTMFMAGQIYESATQDMYDFDCVSKGTAQDSKRVLQSFSGHLPLACVVDFIERYENTGAYSDVLTDMLVKNDDIYTCEKFTKSKHKAILGMLSEKKRISSETFRFLKSQVALNYQKRHLLKMLHSDPLHDPELCSDYVQSKDLNLIKMMVVSPHISYDTIDEIKELDIKPINDLLKFTRHLTEDGRFAYPQQTVHLRMFAHSLLSKDDEFILPGFLKDLYPFDKNYFFLSEDDYRIFTKNIEKALKDEDIDKTFKTKIKHFKTRIDKMYYKILPLTKLDFFYFDAKEEKPKIDCDKIAKYTEKEMEDAINQIVHSDSSFETLKLLETLMIESLSNISKVWKDGYIKIFRCTDLFNALEDRMLLTKTIEQQIKSEMEQTSER